MSKIRLLIVQSNSVKGLVYIGSISMHRMKYSYSFIVELNRDSRHTKLVEALVNS